MPASARSWATPTSGFLLAGAPTIFLANALGLVTRSGACASSSASTARAETFPNSAVSIMGFIATSGGSTALTMHALIRILVTSDA